MLAPVSEFITVMKDFGLPFAMAAAVVGGATWKQEIHIDLVKAFRFLFKTRRPPPEKDDERIDLGFCKFRGEINSGIYITPFGNRHAGFVFEIIGEFQQAIIGKAAETRAATAACSFAQTLRDFPQVKVTCH